MTLNELKTRLETEKHITGCVIELGKKTASPLVSIIGIYEENGCWHIYYTTDREEIVVVDHGSEEEMTEALYSWVLDIEKRLLEEEKERKR